MTAAQRDASPLSATPVTILATARRCTAMTASELAKHMAWRQTSTAKVRGAHGDYKVRSQCCSISAVGAAVCPVCHAYRWVLSPDAVCVVAEFGGRSPFPFTAAVVPRLPT